MSFGKCLSQLVVRVTQLTSQFDAKNLCGKILLQLPWTPVTELDVVWKMFVTTYLASARYKSITKVTTSRVNSRQKHY